jgi:hypothetical protein
VRHDQVRSAVGYPGHRLFRQRAAGLFETPRPPVELEGRIQRDSPFGYELVDAVREEEEGSIVAQPRRVGTLLQELFPGAEPRTDRHDVPLA